MAGRPTPRMHSHWQRGTPIRHPNWTRHCHRCILSPGRCGCSNVCIQRPSRPPNERSRSIPRARSRTRRSAPLGAPCSTRSTRTRARRLRRCRDGQGQVANPGQVIGRIQLEDPVGAGLGLVEAAHRVVERHLRVPQRVEEPVGDRGDVVAATAFSILNKVFDLAPPLLIGAALLVSRDDSGPL